jgi:hypothetical protein
MPEIVGTILASIAFGIFLTTWMPQIISAQKQPVQNQAALHISQIATAARSYITANFATLLTRAASGPFAITVDDLEASPGYYLDPATFVDTTPYQHTHIVLVYSPSANFLDALVVGLGGQTIPDTTLARACRQL